MNIKDDSKIAFFDLLFNMAFIFCVLFYISIILVNDPIKNKNVEKKAEYIITIEWGNELDDDVDSYLEDPNGNITYFSSRENDMINLERDDVGFRNDRRKVNGKEVGNIYNTETISIRGVMSGDYIFNVHLYSKRSRKDISTLVKVTLYRLNPAYKIVTTRTVKLNIAGDEVTVFRFTINPDRSVTDINQLEKLFVRDMLEKQYRNNRPGGYERYDNYPHGYDYEDEYDENYPGTDGGFYYED